MVQIQNLSFSIGDLQLLKDVDWVIKPGKRIGLIGPNGAGKTTLFRLLTGKHQPVSGQISIPKNYSIGYLPQEEIRFENKSLLDLVLQGHEELVQIEQEIKLIHDQLDQDKENLSFIKKLGLLEDRYQLLGGYQLEPTAKKVLQGLGFKEGDSSRSILEFSGGWRMRGHLARLLLQNPDLLLLDEPTNHLDLPSLEWLEDYLPSFSGTIIIISHDRFFLDRLVNEIAELNKGRLSFYTGNFHFYEKKKELETEQLIKAFEAQQAERARIQKFIDRFRSKNTKAVQVQSRIKMLEKMEKIELPEQASTFSFRIKADVKSYNDVLQISDLSFGYDKNPVFKELNLKIIRGEKVALVGENGEGKTTLTKLIYGDLKAQSGLLQIGERVNIGYYAQHQVDALNLNRTIFEEVEESAAPSFRTKLRDILGLFRFRGDDVHKKISVLSGGEKARVSLAKILLSPCNFLIMDEPTNHLDILSKDALEHALRHYDGTLLVISHDRYFLDQLVNRVIEIRGGIMYDYPGNYSYYTEKRQQFNRESKPGVSAPIAKTEILDNTGSSGFKTKEQKRQEAEARQIISRKRNELQKKITAIETNLENLTARKKDLEILIADPKTYNDPKLPGELNREYKETENKIAAEETLWAEYQLELEKLLETINT